MKSLAAALGLTFLAGPSAVVPAQPASTQAFAPTRFSAEVVGTGPDVILIPGLTASKEVWRPTVAALPGYRYHLVQVAGFAGAPARGNTRGEIIAPLAEEIAHYIAANKLQRPAIVGHSMGGTLAMMIAARHPSLVGKVMVVDMLPQPAGLLGSSATRMRGLADALRDLGATETGRGLIDSAIRLFGNDQAVNTRSDPDVVARATHELALTDLTPELRNIAAPLTVLYASPYESADARLESDYTSAYAAAKNARLVRIERSGHMIMYEQPARFRGALNDFLAR